MRRGTLALVLVLIAPVLAAEAQQAGRVYRIGSLHSAFAPNVPWVEGLTAGLAELGLRESREVLIEHRFTEGDLRALPGAAQQLIQAGVDLIFTAGQPATEAARTATQTLPVVFIGVGDPVAAGLVRSIARPGGNITGVSSLRSELAAKRLEILKELAPAVRRVWIIYDVGDLAAPLVVRKAAVGASRLGVELVARPVGTAQELAGALAAFRPRDGVMIHDGPTLLDISAQILKASQSAGIPVIFPAPFWLQWGGLVSYGPDYHAMGHQAARLVARILRGTQPADLPVEGANKIPLVINLKAARAIGLTVPPSLLLRADEAIQ